MDSLKLSEVAEKYFRQKMLARLTLALYFPLLGVLLFVEDRYLKLSYFPGLLFVVGIPSALLYFAFVKRWLFVCPNCEKRFFGKSIFYLVNLKKNCIHCGFSEDEMKKAFEPKKN